jgi:hypothetical protein
MNTDDLSARITRFERNVATCLCALPILFSAQCVVVAFGAPAFGAMFADFGAKLPLPTQFVLNTWRVWAAFGLVIPIGCLILARKGNSNISVIVSTTLGVLLFILAQALTVALFLPIFQLGAVANGQ